MSLTWIYSLYYYAECLLSLSITNIYFIINNLLSFPIFIQPADKTRQIFDNSIHIYSVKSAKNQHKK